MLDGTNWIEDVRPLVVTIAQEFVQAHRAKRYQQSDALRALLANHGVRVTYQGWMEATNEMRIEINCPNGIGGEVRMVHLLAKGDGGFSK